MMNAKQRIEEMRHGKGYTLIELMMVIGILAIVSAIAIPSYNGYISTSRDATTRANIEPLRLALEDFWLDSNSGYDLDGTGGPWVWKADESVQTLWSSPLGWKPDGDEKRFDYDVTLSGATDAIITVDYLDDGGNVVATASSVLSK